MTATASQILSAIEHYPGVDPSVLRGTSHSPRWIESRRLVAEVLQTYGHVDREEIEQLLKSPDERLGEKLIEVGLKLVHAAQKRGGS